MLNNLTAEDQDLRLVRLVLEERIYQNEPQWQQVRALRLSRLLDGVSDAPNPTAQLLSNCIEAISPDDYPAAYELAGVLLDHVDIVLSALKRRKQ